MPTHEPKFHSHLGRTYLIIAEFPDTEAGNKSANTYMAAHPNAGVLAVPVSYTHLTLPTKA